MSDLAELGLSLNATPMLEGLKKVDAALDKTAAKAETMVKSMQTATGRMEAALKSLNQAPAAGAGTAEMQKMNYAIEHQAKAYENLLRLMRQDSDLAKSSAAQRIILNSAFSNATAEISEATVEGAKMLAGLRSQTAATTSLAVATSGLTSTEKELIDAKTRKNLVVKQYRDSVLAEISAQTKQIALSDSHVQAYNREIAAIEEKNRALRTQRRLQESMGRDIIALQRQSNASLGLSTDNRNLFTPFAQDPKVLAAYDELTRNKLANDQAMRLSQERLGDAIVKDMMRQDKAIRSLMERRDMELQRMRWTAERAAAGPGATGGDLYQQAGVKSPTQRVNEIDAVRLAMNKLHEEHAAGIVRGQAYTRTLAELNAKMNLLTEGNSRARGAFRQTAAAVASLTFEMTGAAYGVAALGAILAGPAAFGFKLLSNLEQTKLGMSAILVSMGKINGEAVKLPEALEIAGKMTQSVQENALKYGVNLNALADTTRSIMAPGLGAGLNLQEIQKIALAGSIAVKTIGLDSRQSVQEIRDLVAGGIQAASSTLARSLNINDKLIKEWTAAGTLYENLMERLAGFQDTALLNAQTLSGAWDIFVQKIQLAFANTEMFDQFKAKLIEVSNNIGKVNEETGKFEFNPALVRTVEEYWQGLKLVAETLSMIGEILVTITPLAIELAKGFLMLKALDFGTSILKGLGELSGGAAGAAGQVEGVIDTVKRLNNTKSPIVRISVVLAAWEAGQTIGSWLYEKFSTEIGDFMEPINRLIYNFGKDWGATIVDGFAAAIRIGFSGPIPMLLKKFFGDPDSKLAGVADSMRAPAPKAAPRTPLLQQWDRPGWQKLTTEDRMKMVTGTPSGSGGKDGGGKEKVSEAEKFVQALKKEADAFGLAGLALKRYEAGLLGLNKAQRASVANSIAMIERKQQEAEFAKLQGELAQEAIDKDAEQVKAIEDLVAARSKDIKEMEFEVSLIGMTNEEREKAILLHELSVNSYGEMTAATAGANEQMEKMLALQRRLADNKRVEGLIKDTDIEKTKEFMENIRVLDDAFFRGDIQENVYTQAIDSATGKMDKAAEEMDTFTKKMAKNFQSAIADFLINPFEDGLSGLLKSFGEMIQRMIAEAVAADLTRRMFGEGGLGGSGSSGGGGGWVGAAIDFIGGIFSADGNAFVNGMPVQAFAMGGVPGISSLSGSLLDKPTMFGIGGEAGEEAVVPLKRGKDGKLGISSSGSAAPTMNFNFSMPGIRDAREAKQAEGVMRRSVLAAMNQSQRYR